MHVKLIEHILQFSLSKQSLETKDPKRNQFQNHITSNSNELTRKRNKRARAMFPIMIRIEFAHP